jgi:hypothetical protein
MQSLFVLGRKEDESGGPLKRARRDRACPCPYALFWHIFLDDHMSVNSPKSKRTDSRSSWQKVARAIL